MQQTITIHVDGSYTPKNPTIVGWGFSSEDKTINESGSVFGKITKMRQIGGEIKAVMEAIRYAYTNKYDKIIICYDYIGIEKWITGEWKAKNDWTQGYFRGMNTTKNKIQYEFKKVSGKNNKADSAARKDTGAKCAH